MTDETAARLPKWMDEDEYGFCYPPRKGLGEGFGKANLAGLGEQIAPGCDAGYHSPNERGWSTSGSRWGQCLTYTIRFDASQQRAREMLVAGARSR